MASTGVYRKIVVPFGTTDNGTFDEVGFRAAVVSLVASTANVLLPAITWEYSQYYQFIAGQFVFGRSVTIELFETTLGDVAILANFPAFQTALSLLANNVGPAVTWSWNMTFGV